MAKPTEKTRKGLSDWLHSSNAFRKGWHIKKVFFIQGKMEYIWQVPHGCPWGCAWVQGTQRGPEINCLLMRGCDVTVRHPNQKQVLFLSKQISDVYMKGRKGKKLTGWTGQGSGHWSLGEVCLRASGWKQWTLHCSEAHKPHNQSYIVQNGRWLLNVPYLLAQFYWGAKHHQTKGEWIWRMLQWIFVFALRRASTVSIYNVFLQCWAMLPIPDISVDFLNAMVNQRCLRIHSYPKTQVICTVLSHASLRILSL